MERKDENVFNQALNRLTKDMNILYKDYITDRPAPVLSEYLFQEHFLEFFKKFKDSEPEDLTPEESIKLNKWIELSGGPYREVSVVDNKGKEVFRVPPIYTSNTIESDRIVNEDNSLNRMGKAFSDKLKTNPTTAVPALHSTISALPKFIKPIETQIDDIKKWDKIFQFYDKQSEVADIIPNNPDAVPAEVKERLGLVVKDDDDEDTPL